MAETPTLYTEADEPRSIDYLGWFSRVARLDLLVLLVITGAVIQLARVFPQAGTDQVVVLIGGPLLVFIARFCEGVGQIRGNVCRPELQRRQLVALSLGLVMLAAINTLVGYRAFHLNLGVNPMEIVVVATAIYLPLVIFAMYPGRTRSDANPWRE